MIKESLVFSFCLLLAGCASAGALYVQDVNRPLIELQKIAAKCAPLGLRSTSQNGREFFSQYFQTENRKFKKAEKNQERRFAHILILGDQRPYRIEILVKIERVDPSKDSGYSVVGMDQSLAKVVRNRIRQQLNKRREELNIIDDFRVF